MCTILDHILYAAMLCSWLIGCRSFRWDLFTSLMDGPVWRQLWTDEQVSGHREERRIIRLINESARAHGHEGRKCSASGARQCKAVVTDE